MKRITILLAALTLAASAPAQAQGFLNKLKEKAEQAVNNVGGKIGDAVGGLLPEGAQEAAAAQDGGAGIGAVSGEQALPPKRSSTFGWDGPVTPSSAGTPAALMAAFPKVPSAAALANPTEADQIAFYQAVKAVTLRAEELNMNETCKDEETLLWRQKSNQVLKDAFGLTDAEIEMLQREDLSEAERQRLSDKIAKAMLGDTDTADLEAKAAKFENMSEEELMAAYQRGEMNDLMKVAGQAQQAVGKLAPIMEMERKMSQYFMEVQKLVLVPDTGADAQFSAADRKRVEDLKKQIYDTPDPAKYNPLYLQALELIRSYRERAAKVWAADVQKRFDAMKNNMDALLRLNRQAIADELIPSCALNRAPLNLIISAGDILAEAYSEFPSNYPPMYKEEIVRQAPLNSVPGGSGGGSGTSGSGGGSGSVSPWFPEFTVLSTAQFDEIVAGNFIFASNGGGEVFQYTGGNWARLTKDRVKQLSEMKKSAGAAGGRWTSKDGKREVVYNAEMGLLTLPEGDVVSPHAIKPTADAILWTVQRYDEASNTVQIIQCTYKL
ncbi:MAG: hypothetical protein IKR32_03730 [Bacteroidales bacterium]|nr:hypothetical protein [Bacteroidales bacterium]